MQDADGEPCCWADGDCESDDDGPVASTSGTADGEGFLHAAYRSLSSQSGSHRAEETVTVTRTRYLTEYEYETARRSPPPPPPPHTTTTSSTHWPGRTAHETAWSTSFTLAPSRSSHASRTHTSTPSRLPSSSSPSSHYRGSSGSQGSVTSIPAAVRSSSSGRAPSTQGSSSRSTSLFSYSSSSSSAAATHLSSESSSSSNSSSGAGGGSGSQSDKSSGSGLTLSYGRGASIPACTNVTLSFSGGTPPYELASFWYLGNNVTQTYGLPMGQGLYEPSFAWTLLAPIRANVLFMLTDAAGNTVIGDQLLPVVSNHRGQAADQWCQSGNPYSQYYNASAYNSTHFAANGDDDDGGNGGGSSSASASTTATASADAESDQSTTSSIPHADYDPQRAKVIQSVLASLLALTACGLAVTLWFFFRLRRRYSRGLTAQPSRRGHSAAQYGSKGYYGATEDVAAGRPGYPPTSASTYAEKSLSGEKPKRWAVAGLLARRRASRPGSSNAQYPGDGGLLGSRPAPPPHTRSSDTLRGGDEPLSNPFDDSASADARYAQAGSAAEHLLTPRPENMPQRHSTTSLASTVPSNGAYSTGSGISTEHYHRTKASTIPPKFRPPSFLNFSSAAPGTKPSPAAAAGPSFDAESTVVGGHSTWRERGDLMDTRSIMERPSRTTTRDSLASGSAAADVDSEPGRPAAGAEGHYGRARYGSDDDDRASFSNVSFSSIERGIDSWDDRRAANNASGDDVSLATYPDAASEPMSERTRSRSSAGGFSNASSAGSQLTPLWARGLLRRS